MATNFLLNEDDGQYYAGQQYFTGQASAGGSGQNKVLPSTSFNTNLVSAYNSSAVQIGSASNFEVYFRTGSNAYKKLKENNISVANNIITILSGSGSTLLTFADGTSVLQTGQIPSGDYYVQLKSAAKAYNYGEYQYIKLNDIINNFIVGYVGADKIIAQCKRTDVLFHARRAMQEFSYDTLKVIKSQELAIPASLSLPFPKDYVNYVRVSWIDNVGAKHIIYPTRITSNPTEIYGQDSDGEAIQDNFGNNTSLSSTTDSRYAAMNINTSTTTPDDYRYPKDAQLLGARFGIQPEEAQVNGKFTINEREGTFSFSSGLVNKLIILEYISDGLAVTEDMRVPKLAEEAMYKQIAYAILSTRSKVPEYIVQRYKLERRAALRNAKLRLSNIKIEEIAQVFRNRNKWIKH
tara:strand:+ start:673 stop:1893 length:1221 start_codon:yes stop_codon:yes gene_type:complete